MTDPIAALREGLRDRYAFERELGRGGMATVYLARDLRHDRPVALKVLHPELAASLGPERFQREIRLAARLQHPHILSVHDSGQVDRLPGEAPVLWFTMPFVEGESLRQRLSREKQLPIEDALRIGREAADALAFAHRHGIIHRDIKPENILLMSGHALVADFGIARALSGEGTGQQGGGPEERLTDTGLAIGTPAYMSPEQAAGERALDARSDIYSLGCVIWEMLAGEPPFAAPTVQAMMARRFKETPRPLREVRETVADAVDRAVAKSLAKSPADRFATAEDFAKALEAASRTGERPATRPQPDVDATGKRKHPIGLRRAPLTAALVVGFLLGLGVLFGWLRKHDAGPPEASGPRRLAVLPFENLGAPQDEYFADGVTDEIRGKLAGLPGLQVTARSSSSPYKRTTKQPAEVGRELGVDYLLTGTVRWEKGAGASRVRVSPELIQVATGSSRWQQPFDAALSDVFQVQADIAGRVAEALNLALEAPKQEQLAERPTASLAAYDAYLKGEDAAQGIWGVNPGDLRRAAGHFEQAVALDSGFALAWAQLSRVLSYANFIGTPDPAAAARARLAGERAVFLAPNRPAGRLALGDYQRNITYDNTQAQTEYAEGLRLAPNDIDLLTGAALADQSLGRWDEALAGLQRTFALDPRSVSTARRLAFTLLWMRRYPEALRVSDQAIELDPTHLQTRSTRAMIYLAQGDLTRARQVIRQTPPGIEPTTLVAYIATYWDLYWLLDDEQQQLLLRLRPSAFDDDLGNWAIVNAQVHALRGDSAKARAYGDSSAVAFREQLKATPEDAQRNVLLGVALAYAGRKREAISAGREGVRLLPVSQDAYGGAYNEHQLARLYVLTGEHDRAIDLLEHLLGIPYYLSPGWLRVDPAFAPLRNHPRFVRLLQTT